MLAEQPIALPFPKSKPRFMSLPLRRSLNKVDVATLKMVVYTTYSGSRPSPLILEDALEAPFAIRLRFGQDGDRSILDGDILFKPLRLWRRSFLSPKVESEVSIRKVLFPTIETVGR